MNRFTLILLPLLLFGCTPDTDPALLEKIKNLSDNITKLDGQIATMENQMKIVLEDFDLTDEDFDFSDADFEKPGGRRTGVIVEVRRMDRANNMSGFIVRGIRVWHFENESYDSLIKHKSKVKFRKGEKIDGKKWIVKGSIECKEDCD